MFNQLDLHQQEQVKAEVKKRYNRGVMNLHSYRFVAGDLIAGILLSQLLYWCGDGARGIESKLRIKKHGHYWLVKKRTDWEEETGITPKQYDRAIKILEDKEIVIRKVYRFGGDPTTHIRINYLVFNQRFKEWEEQEAEKIVQDMMAEGELEITQRDRTEFAQRDRTEFAQRDRTEITQRDNSLYTETTTENTTTETTTETTPERNSGQVLEDRFDLFWKTYPKKVGKKNCLTIWKKIKPSLELTMQMIDVIEREKKTEQWRKDNGQFIPNPSTWLNQERWEDEPTEVFKTEKEKAHDAWLEQLREKDRRDEEMMLDPNFSL